MKGQNIRSHLKNPKLYVSEIFFSIQGESSYSGLPFIFIRLAGCNLRCRYCDTKHAYEESRQLSIDAILKRIKRYPCNNVEVTGGEPLLQGNAIPLISALVKAHYTVLLETNGSIDISGTPPEIVRIVDIKCPDSGEGDSFNFGNIAHLRVTDEVKFVLSSKKDYNYAKKIIADYELANKCKVIMSGVSEKIAPKKIAEWMLKDGISARLQIQLHKHIWGDKRGV